MTLNRKIYFASDFHLGVPTHTKSLEREKKIVRWLDEVSKDASDIFLVGDVFDYWYEYKQVIPKGFARIQGKIAELTDSGINVHFFIGNHDMWAFNYFEKELGVKMYRDNTEFVFFNRSFLIGHGDGYGPRDYGYKFLKKIFANPLCQWIFGWVHPNIGIGIAKFWSGKSRIANAKNEEIVIKTESEWLVTYAKEVLKDKHYDFFIFGHRHLPLDINVGQNSKYVNLGEWINHYTYAVFDGNELELKTYNN